MYTHYTTTKNKQQFNSIWLNLQHTHIALCCKGTWVTYMKKEVLLVKKKKYYSLISSYNLHCTSVCQTESKSWQENKTWADFLCPNSHQISWSLINNVFGIKLRLHKKNNLWSLQGYNHIIHKSLFVTKALLLPVIPHSKIMQSSTKHQAYIFFVDYLIILPTEIRLGEVLYSSIRHTCLNKRGYNLLVSCSSHCSNDLVGCWHYMNTQTVILDSEFSWVQLCFVWPTDQTIWGASVFNIMLT